MGLFKKKKLADTIYFGGTIYTMDPSYPEAEAVAVREERIIAVGEYEAIAEDLQGPETELVDLKGAYMTPGLIDLDGDCTPVFLRDLAKKQQEEMEALQKSEEENRREGDSESPEPEDAFEEDSEENVSFALDEDSDLFEEYAPAEAELLASARAFAERGVTSVLNLEHSAQADDMFRNMLMARWENGALSQRYFASPRLSAMMNVDYLLYFMSGKKTLCNELEGFINSDHIHLVFSSDAEDPHYMSEEYLNVVSEELAQRNFNVLYVPLDEGAMEFADSLAEEMRTAYHKVSFTVVKEHSYNDPAEQLEAKTLAAANVLGVSKNLGSIEEGKIADFAIFEKDPLVESSRARTVLAGKEVVC